MKHHHSWGHEKLELLHRITDRSTFLLKDLILTSDGLYVASLFHEQHHRTLRVVPTHMLLCLLNNSINNDSIDRLQS